MAAVVFSAFVPSAPAKADSELTACVLVPHFKDEYWLSVGYGLEQEADKYGVNLLFFEAGGYQSVVQQIGHLSACAERGVDAILLGAVSSDDPDLLAKIADISQDLPVFGLVNELSSPDLWGQVGVDWEEMGQKLGAFLADRHPKGSDTIQTVFISGPIESGWVTPLETGLRNGLSDSAVETLAILRADTGLRQQLNAVEEAFERYPDIDLLVGSAPAVEAAIGLIIATSQHDDTLLASTYISHTIKRAVMNGRVLAVPFDDPIRQGMQAIEQMLWVLDHGKVAGFTGPEITLISKDNIHSDRVVLSPADYFPEIQ